MAKCLYNGVKLPALPEWDKSAYPYAVIMRYGSSAINIRYQLVCTKVPVVTSDTRYNLSHPDYKDLASSPPFALIRSETTKSSAESWGALTFNSVNLMSGYVLWTNYDMKDLDGNLRVATTTPIPVAELDPTTMVTGWRVGRAIASQRKKQTKVSEPVYE